MSQKRFSIGRLLQNNKIAFAVSVVLAVILWLIVAIWFSDQQEAVLTEIPVSIDTNMTDKLDLQMFGQTDFKVTVQVTGKRYEVSSAVLSKEDFVVTASTVNVSSAGKYTLPVTVRTADAGSDVKIISFSPETVDVYFDYNLTENYVVEAQLNTEGGSVAADGFIAGDAILSTAEVTVSGAATEVQKIARVVAKVSVQKPLSETTKYENTDISILNENGGIVRSAYVSVADGISAVTVTVPIFKIVQFKPTVRFKNTPTYFLENPINYTCYPTGTIHAAVSTELLGSADSFSLGTIDFSDVTSGLNTFTFDAADIPNIRILDESIDSFKVIFSMEGFQTRKFTLTADEISLTGLAQGITATLPEDTSVEIVVIGLPYELELLTLEDILATADASVLREDSKTAQLPLNFSMEKSKCCWVYGDYTVNVHVS